MRVTFGFLTVFYLFPTSWKLRAPLVSLFRGAVGVLCLRHRAAVADGDGVLIPPRQTG